MPMLSAKDVTTDLMIRYGFQIDPVAALQAQHAAQGLRLHARTTCPGWLGERLDVGWAIDVLHPLCNASRPISQG